MGNSDYIVSPDGDGWTTSKNGSKRVSARTETQAEAYEKAKQFSSNQGGGEVSIQGRNGRIREKNTIAPAKDPRSSKG